MGRHFPDAWRSLLQAHAYPHPVGAIELIETPISWVLCTGEFAYKIKRPVRYDFIDQTEPARRAALCAEELRLNRAFAPELYLGLRSICPDGEGVRFGAAGTGVEQAVLMRQFAAAEELDRLLAAGRVEPDELAQFGAQHAAVLKALAPLAAPSALGSASRVGALVLANIEQCLRAARSIGFGESIAALRAPLQERLLAALPWLTRRREGGFFRECHGDLHTRNVVRYDGRLVAFDALEFEPALRWIDVADEIAFLCADLAVRGWPRHALAFLQGYLAASGDYQACRLQPLYQAHRALVRVKVAALSAADDTRAREEVLRGTRWVQHQLNGGAPHLVLMSGFSGSGKTWLATRLAERLPAVHLRSDVERKRLAGLAPGAASGSPLGGALYAPEASALLYEHLHECAESVLSGGYSLIIDAAFLQRAERARLAALARRLNVPVRLIVCTAHPDLLRQRIRERQRSGRDASEADVAVLDWQMQHSELAVEGEGLALLRVDTASPRALAMALGWLGVGTLGEAGLGN